MSSSSSAASSSTAGSSKRASEVDSVDKIDIVETRIEFFDPHFHIWDVSEEGTHDGSVLFAPAGNELYDVKSYEKDVSPGDMKHIGGTFLEAMSVCFVEEDGPGYLKRCVAELEWTVKELEKSSLTYVLVPTLPLENPASFEAMRSMAKRYPGKVCGIRQILNYEPSWPRCARLGNLLKNAAWRKGFASLASVGYSFDMQLNPHQFSDAYELIKQNPSIPAVVINHLGTPTREDLADSDRADVYWSGLSKLASLPNVYIKLSQLCYVDPNWDKSKDGIKGLVPTTVRRVVDIFGVDNCFFASNYPVDLKDGWDAGRLFTAFRRLASDFSMSDRRKLFSENAMRVYRVKKRGVD